MEKALKNKPVESTPALPTSIDWKVSESSVSKSTQKRLDREAADSERRRAIDAAHRGDEKYGREEMESIQRLLSQEDTNLVIESIPSDGSCLFSSIARNIPSATPQGMRAQCTEFIRKKPNDFAPFIDFDFDEYLKQLQHSAWGGELEIAALSKSLKRPIHVFRKSGKIIFGENNATPIRVSFHEYLFSQPHYNAVIAR